MDNNNVQQKIRHKKIKFYIKNKIKMEITNKIIKFFKSHFKLIGIHRKKFRIIVASSIFLSMNKIF
jgi:hypothetical protein